MSKRMDITSPPWLAKAIASNVIVLHGMGKFTRDMPWVEIHTLEGVMRGNEGDWIIQGVAGELYPCKPEIFAQTYEPADAAPTPPAQDDYPPRMKREDDCMTLQDWRIRAMNLEASWANCSQACARIQGQRDEALEMLRSLAMAIERRQSLVGSPAWKQAHETFLDAMERARAMLAKRGKT